jgi:hypothetical protein
VRRHQPRDSGTSIVHALAAPKDEVGRQGKLGQPYRDANLAGLSTHREHLLVSAKADPSYR